MKDTRVKSDQKQNSATMLMTEGKIWKQLLVFAVPLILGNLLQQMYNAVDSIIVGNYVGSNALAAVGSSNALINLLIAFAQGASVGAGVVISQFLGAGDTKRVHRAVHTAATIALLLGVMLTGAGIALSRVLLVAMDTPTAVLNDSVLYLRIYAGGFLFNVVYNMATGILNAAGNSRRPLLYLGAASVTNIVLDLVLIEGCKMGVAGAAVATDVSQLISCLLAVSYLLRVKSDYRIRVKSLCLDGDMARRIVRVGLPTGIQNMVISFSNVLVQTSVNHYGAMAMAGFTAYLKVDGFNILPVLSISMAVTTFVGQNYGAGNLKRVKSGMWTALLMSTVYTILTGALLLAFSHPVMRLFTSDSAAIHYGVLAMKYFCPYYVLLGALNVLAGTVRGTGKSIPPMLILLFSMCIFRIIWIQLAVPHYDNIDGVFILYPISWVIGLVLMALYTWKGHWLHYGNENERAKEA